MKKRQTSTVVAVLTAPYTILIFAAVFRVESRTQFGILDSNEPDKLELEWWAKKEAMVDW